ncbi:hypothetical protein PIB30_043296 [Stylosanthes scabra]|uniref:Uncharacterized protein n=1 Tax=Stylosanthes scabra TaxID=79078 RepID=A0ABU6YHD0_9FABA|nr:hypothetical protein [Stylosanthes scabra]
MNARRKLLTLFSKKVSSIFAFAERIGPNYRIEPPSKEVYVINKRVAGVGDGTALFNESNSSSGLPILQEKALMNSPRWFLKIPSQATLLFSNQGGELPFKDVGVT